ncbi:hypothetical protein E0485_22335 [Paenibacillus albiflavus]|uniref:Uncharacterized protein n=1 Tax=Paenibacillus albiflavus TaxID=2545760 RepID=A0A4R4E400_9BACL|nr:hypothetical protein [Paenibacillus albiflavus]TCZ72326.1 hypothetical protein E0485_22335 [Paenibacillus albiflavus]
MIGELFGKIIDFLKSTAPITIVSNIAICVILIIVGLVLLSKKQQQTNAKKIGGWVCVSTSILAFVGAVSNWIFSYVIF